MARLLRGEGPVDCAPLHHSGPVRQGGPCWAARSDRGDIAPAGSATGDAGLLLACSSPPAATASTDWKQLTLEGGYVASALAAAPPAVSSAPSPATAEPPPLRSMTTAPGVSAR